MLSKLKDYMYIFRHNYDVGNMVQASDLKTGAETDNFPWRKIYIVTNKMLEVHRRNFNKQFFHQEKSMYFTIWMNNLCQTEQEI